MAEAGPIFECCVKADEYLPATDSGGCGGTYTPVVTSVSIAQSVGIYTQAHVLSKTCVYMDVIPCSGGTLYVRINMGCVPKSVFPVTVYYNVKKNGVNIYPSSQTYILIAGNTTSCPNCLPVCVQS